MPFTRCIIVLFLSIAALAAPLSAQDTSGDRSRMSGSAAGDSLVELGEITVTASRIDVAVGAAAQRVTLIGPDAIEQSGARNLAELLDARAGLFVRQYGDGLATISLRGSSPSQTLLLLDGLPLTDPQLGQLDLSLFPTYVMGAVEVMHGPGSALYGTSGVGGIINVRSRFASGSGFRLTSEMGAFGERRVGGGASWNDEQAGAVIAAEYAEAEGDFPYNNVALFPVRQIRRRNADRQSRSVYASGHVYAGSHRVRVGMLYADAVRGIPGLATVTPQGERQWDEHVRFWVTDDMRLQAVTLSLRGFLHHSALRYADPGLDLDDTGRTVSGYVESELGVRITDRWVVGAGMGAGYARADHPNLRADAAELHGTGFAEAVGLFGRIAVYPAIRLDAYRDRAVDGGGRAAMSPRLGLNVQVFEALPIHLKAAAGRAFRNPTFNERFWMPGGDPDLDPERSWSYEAGIYAGPGDVSLEITGFGAHARDQIVWTPGETRMWAPVNIAQTRSAGLETSARALMQLGSVSLEGGAVYAFTRAVDRSDPGSRTYDRQLRYVPRNQLKGYAAFSRGPIEIDVSTRLIGRRFVTADQSESLPAALTLDVQAGFRKSVGSFRFSLVLFVENALDREYAVIQHYPMPPRHARIRLIVETIGGN